MKRWFGVFVAVVFLSTPAMADFKVLWEVSDPDGILTGYNLYLREDPGQIGDADLLNGVGFTMTSLPVTTTEHTYTTEVNEGVWYCIYLEAVSPNRIVQSDVHCVQDGATRQVIRYNLDLTNTEVQPVN